MEDDGHLGMTALSRVRARNPCISWALLFLRCQVAELSERLSTILTMKRSRKLSRSGWRDRQKTSVLMELTVCQKNVANAMNSAGIMLKNKV